MLKKNIIENISELNNWLHNVNLLVAANPRVLKDRSPVEICIIHLLLQQQESLTGLSHALKLIKFNSELKIKKLTKTRTPTNTHVDYARSLILNDAGLEMHVICNQNFTKDLKSYTEFKSQEQHFSSYGAYSSYDDLLIYNLTYEGTYTGTYQGLPKPITSTSLIIFPFQSDELCIYKDDHVIKKKNGLYAYKFIDSESHKKSPLLHFDSRDGTLRRLFIRASSDPNRNNTEFRKILEHVAPSNVIDMFIKHSLQSYKRVLDDDLNSISADSIRDWMKCVYSADVVDQAFNLYPTHRSPHLLYMHLTGQLNELNNEPPAELPGLF